ncbi:hypothetical protein Tco_0418682 [Tanacetum coccineum]
MLVFIDREKPTSHSLFFLFVLKELNMRQRRSSERSPRKTGESRAMRHLAGIIRRDIYPRKALEPCADGTLCLSSAGIGYPCYGVLRSLVLHESHKSKIVYPSRFRKEYQDVKDIILVANKMAIIARHV